MAQVEHKTYTTTLWTVVGVIAKDIVTLAEKVPKVEAYLYDHTSVVCAMFGKHYGAVLIATVVVGTSPKAVDEECMRLRQYQADRLSSGLFGVDGPYYTYETAMARCAEITS